MKKMKVIDAWTSRNKNGQSNLYRKEPTVVDEFWSGEELGFGMLKFEIQEFYPHGPWDESKRKIKITIEEA